MTGLQSGDQLEQAARGAVSRVEGARRLKMTFSPPYLWCRMLHAGAVSSLLSAHQSEVEVRVSLCLEEYRMLAVWRVQQAEYPVD